MSDNHIAVSGVTLELVLSLIAELQSSGVLTGDQVTKIAKEAHQSLQGKPYTDQARGLLSVMFPETKF